MLDAGRNIVTKDEGKAEVSNTFFVSVFNRKTAYPQGNQPPELLDRDREQNRCPAIHAEVVSDLLSHFDTHKSMGSDHIHLSI